MSRIRARGRPLQVHETEDFLTELARAYARICRVLEERCDVPVVKIQVDQTTPEETTRTVVDAVLDQVQRQGEPEVVEGYAPDSIEIVATTMSGSIQDQRKVGQIGPEFRSRTAQPVRVHLARNHAEAQAAARAIVTGGGRTIVSAGGAGTFNAVLEGCHVNGIVPADLHLAFLRKGSADLIGKALNVPDELQAAAAAIVDGIESDHLVAADILAIEAADPKGRKGVRHMVGFGGLGIFGDVPRFTETRVVKFYKGILGTLFGDLGPFYVGLALATIYWRIQRLLSRVSPISLTLDGEELPPDIWGTVTVINGDLGKDFPLGRGLALSSGSFRVVALRYRGMRKALKQINACRTARVLDDPDHYAAIVRDVRDLRARPVKPTPPYMVNVDGLRMMVRGAVRIRVSGQVQLVAGQRAPRQGSSQETKELQPA
jgi:diacylglycerol kinase family enzyme